MALSENTRPGTATPCFLGMNGAFDFTCKSANNGSFSAPTRIEAPSSLISAGYFPDMNTLRDIWQDRTILWYVWDVNCAD